MEILINQKTHTLDQGASLEDALTLFGAAPPFAVALNGVFVHRGDYAKRRLAPGDRLEVVQPVAGG